MTKPQLKNRVTNVPRNPMGSHYSSILMAAALLAATFIAMLPATGGSYLWDDDAQLYDNQFIIHPGGLAKLWFSSEPTDYWPLTSTTLWIEWRVWGNNPIPYHVTNILLHALSAVILWRLLKRLGLSDLASFLGGLLFAVHPVTVASAAWIAERKNVLSMVLSLLCLLAYLRFEEEGRPKWYVFAVLAAAGALLAKTSVVALPVILLLLTWWRRDKLQWRDLLRVVPFLLLSLVLGLVTLWFHHYNSIAGVAVRPEGAASRIASVGWVFWFYLYKLVLPVNLIMIYPRWEIDGGHILSFVPLVAMIACFVVLWLYRKRFGMGPLVALAAYVALLAPVLGLLTMAYAQYSLVADHLQYPGIPAMTALAGCGGAAAISWSQRKHHSSLTSVLGTAISAIIVALMVLSWQQAMVYRNKVSLWTHTIAHNDGTWTAYYNRGVAWEKTGDYAKAILDYTKVLELKPDYAEAYNNRSLAYHVLGKYDLALDDANKGIELRPKVPTLYSSRGSAYFGLGDFSKAVDDYTKAIELNPNYARAYGNRATAYFLLKEYDKSWADVKMCRQLGETPNPVLVEELVKATGRMQ